jgi:hypothetical protein
MTPAAEAPGATGNCREHRCRTQRSPCTEQRLRRDRARTGRSVPPGRGELAIHRQRILGRRESLGQRQGSGIGAVLGRTGRLTGGLVLVSATRVILVTLCYRRLARVVARVVARESGHSERREHSGTCVLLSVQVACPGRCTGLLVMRRSGVRFPKAAQFNGLISLVRSVAVALHGRATHGHSVSHRATSGDAG